MKFFEELKIAILNEDLSMTDEILEKVKYETNAFDYVEPLFRVVEENPNLDYGSPGPIVHFIEEFKGYETLLIESIKRRPTFQTIWMLNRIINISDSKNKDYYLSILKSLLDRKDISNESKNAAERFYHFQMGN